jgi:hypothetical protein
MEAMFDMAVRTAYSEIPVDGFVRQVTGAATGKSWSCMFAERVRLVFC